MNTSMRITNTSITNMITVTSMATIMSTAEKKTRKS